jgi:hypothetical protein
MASVGFSNGRLTIDGQPRFILGVYDSGGGYSSDPAAWERQIFEDRNLQGIPINVYLNYWLGAVPADQTRVLLDVLQRHGVYYLQTGNAFEAGGWQRPGLAAPFSIGSENYVRMFAQHPAALGIYTADEPYDALIAETEAHHRQLKAWAPNLLTFAALMAGYPSGHPTRTDPAMWVNAADVLGVDPYPIYGEPTAAGYPVFTVGEYVAKLRAAVPPDRPVWSVTQFFRGTSNSPLPTPEQMRYFAIASIVEGAQGLFFWDIGVGGIRQENAAVVSEYMNHLRTLVTELAALEPALVSSLVFPSLPLNSTRFPDPVAGRISQLQHNVNADWLYSRKEMYQAEIAALQAGDRSKSGGMLDWSATVRTRAMVAPELGRGYVFAYNHKNQRVPVTLTVPGIEQYHVKVWENRTPNEFYDVAGGISWSDTFEPYQAKIYVVGQ